MHYSVLMSVYYKENAAFFRKAIESMLNQTIPTDDFVLVCDGPLNDSLNRVISEMEQDHPDIFHVIRLSENGGLGNALNIGLKHCKNELIARMDSDDISRPDRCEKQLEVFQNNPEISICSGTIEEFTESTDLIDSVRIVPETQEKILAFAKRRCPFNHPCVMYRKSAIVAAGGYQKIYLLEDYFLWIRLLKNGCTGYNIQQPLLWMRGGDSMYKRRTGWRFTRNHLMLYKYMRDSKMINNVEYIYNCLLRIIAFSTPTSFRRKAYSFFLRK